MILDYPARKTSFVTRQEPTARFSNFCGYPRYLFCSISIVRIEEVELQRQEPTFDLYSCTAVSDSYIQLLSKFLQPYKAAPTLGEGKKEYSHE